MGKGRKNSSDDDEIGEVEDDDLDEDEYQDDGDDNDDGEGDELDDDDDQEEESPYRDPPDGHVRLRPSSFGLPSTVFFEYPRELGIKRDDKSVTESLGSRKLRFKCYWERICIKNAFLRAGFNKIEIGKKWTALWSKHQNNFQMKVLCRIFIVILYRVLNN